MKMLIIAGITDSPWVVIVVLLGGALVNWLSSRRQKQAEARGTVQPTPDKPEGQFDMEETLRRLLGHEPKTPTGPPPLPRSTRNAPPPIATRIDEDEPISEQGWMEAIPEVVAPSRPLPAARKAVAQAAYISAAAGAHVVGLGTGIEPHHRRCSTSATVVNWRNRGNARQAFVASLVFGTPKGMEP